MWCAAKVMLWPMLSKAAQAVVWAFVVFTADPGPEPESLFERTDRLLPLAYRSDDPWYLSPTYLTNNSLTWTRREPLLSYAALTGLLAHLRVALQAMLPRSRGRVTRSISARPSAPWLSSLQERDLTVYHSSQYALLVGMACTDGPLAPYFAVMPVPPRSSQRAQSPQITRHK